MPSYVITEKCDGCKAQDKTACQYICPNDLMTLNRDLMKAYNQEPDQCWECYNCVKICPQQAIEIRAYQDFAPLGANVIPMRGTDSIMWTIKFRNGILKRFKFPIRTTAEGSVDPFKGKPEADMAKIKQPGYFTTVEADAGNQEIRRIRLMEKETCNFSFCKKPAIEEVETDLLLIGGGMACCGAAFEGARWANPKKIKITMVDKAATDRSGAVAMGLSAINTYMGENDPADYVKMVRNDLMGIIREDLVYDLGRHVDDSVQLFEEWGLPIWKMGDDGFSLDGFQAKEAGKAMLKDGGKPVRSGKWQIMINGESYKVIVAEAAKKALETNRAATGVDTEPLRARVHREALQRCQGAQQGCSGSRLQRS